MFLKIKLVFLLILFFNLPQAFAVESKATRILFIGNSLTFVNDLPKNIADLARSRGHIVQYDSYAPGGYRLSQHASDSKLIAKINQGSWDVVVLQEQSQLPAFPEAQLQTLMYPFAVQLCQIIRITNPKARIAFYETAAKKNGDTDNALSNPGVKAYDGMQKRINAGYAKMTEQNQGILVPVGLVWKKVRASHPSVELYSDDTHPSLTGTYLAALVFYEVLFKESTIKLPHPVGIKTHIATALQEIVDETLAVRA